MEQMETEDNFFRFFELSVNYTIFAIFNPWEVCKMKTYNMLTVEVKIFPTERVPGIRAYPVYCEGPFSCPLFSSLILSSTLSAYMMIRKLLVTM